jgi:hypothetical protein
MNSYESNLTGRQTTIFRYLLVSFVLVLFFSVANTLRAQPLANGSIKIENRLLADIQTGFQSVSGFYFQDAVEQVMNCKRLYPGSAWPYLMSANMIWWKLVSGEMTLDRQQEFMRELDMARQRLTSSHEGLFCDIVSNVMRTRLELLKGNQLAAIRHIKGYYGSVKKSFGQESVYEPFNLTSGLYYYLAAVAWDEYPLLRPLLILFDRGDKVKGTKFLLKAASSDNPIVATEANYFLMRIYFDMEKNKETAFQFASWLVQKHPCNYIYLYYYLKCKPSDMAGDKNADRKDQVLKNHQLSDQQRAYFLFLLHKV